MIHLNDLLDTFSDYWLHSEVVGERSDLEEDAELLLTAARVQPADAFMPVYRVVDSGLEWFPMRKEPYKKIGYAKGMITTDKRLNARSKTKLEYGIQHVVYALKQTDHA